MEKNPNFFRSRPRTYTEQHDPKEILLDDGTTLEKELELLKKRSDLKIGQPISTVDIITTNLETYNTIVHAISKKLSAHTTIDLRSFETLRDEITDVLSNNPNTVIIRDLKTATKIFMGGLHSVDQGLKIYGRKLTADSSKYDSARIIVARYFNGNDFDQLNAALAQNDFLDAHIKITKPQAL
jgi:hypothetical protein